ncbi:hypothetical protein PMM47T1_19908 [Pseudomonas sp. M47T1]|uniref:hypothetical protein n=1 Tax=Pseudomonas sp. M47T1 TaxID=1179778 RepID=UPI00026072DA|nr:hypothetical protein [Pseudomonas sp. M47T1]EIK94796.1 hypothetical protein PMM47T1_19908 [Pseudomonas sp. M47T1]
MDSVEDTLIADLFVALHLLRQRVETFERYLEGHSPALRGHQTPDSHESLLQSHAQLTAQLSAMEQTLAALAEAIGQRIEIDRGR